jgi:hypothetical protein
MADFFETLTAAKKNYGTIKVSLKGVSKFCADKQ